MISNYEFHGDEPDYYANDDDVEDWGDEDE